MSSTPDTTQWQRTSPLAALFFFGQLLQTIAKNAVQTLAPLFAFLVAFQGNLTNKLLIAAVAFVVVTTTISLLRYWFFRFCVTEDSILIRQGVIKKKQTDIRFDRIQGINTQQNIIYRALGLVTVTFDTAGSSGDEGNLPAITRALSEALRAKIGKRKRGTAGIEEPTDPAPEQVLLQLGWKDMVLIGLADRRALVLLAFAGPFFEQAGDQVRTMIANFVEAAAADIAHLGAEAAAVVFTALIVGVFLVIALVSIAMAFLRYHKFKLSLTDRALYSHGGLLTRHEHSMDLGKVQMLRVRQGLVLRIFRRFRFLASQASSGGRKSKGRSFTVPILRIEAANRIRQLLFSPEATSLTLNPDNPGFVRISPYYMRTRMLYAGLLPALTLTAFFWPIAGPVSLLYLLWIPIASAMFWQLWRRYGYLHDNDGLVRRTGLYGYRVDAFLFRKVQRVTVKQSRGQRRRSLATLQVFLASGSIRVPYVDHATACRLRDYILYKVESSPAAWH